ncbi:yqjZ [[Candida] subhashii]|uniref:YqjZ n=1 Tax=[Candida] subhashii TaxID=561895 RepID=A0A8J5QH97_9ASCO|nr:yqjZ [[Candida] subhashii]KAG7662049.1 yqjZ [[Candida] subhashii]
MSQAVQTPKPPYYAVTFSSDLSSEVDDESYGTIADRMVELAKNQPGFLGVQSVRDPITKFGLTISYWKELENIKNWKANSEHLVAQRQGRADFYTHFETRICKVERDYTFDKRK